MQHNTSFGIMDEAYFVPRQQILQWIQKYLKLNISGVQELGTGAIYCQLIDAAFGQKVPMQKVNWKAKFEYEFISNLKLFQTVLQKLGINKRIDIQKLSKAKYQDNLELIQWLKRYIQVSGSICESYPAQERRGHCQLYSITQNKKVLGTSFKTNSSIVSNNTAVLNQSTCTTTVKPKTTKARVSNKENAFNENKTKVNSSSKQTQKMNQIKKVLTSSGDAVAKLTQISKIVFSGQFTSNIQNTSNLMQIQGCQSEEEVF